MKAHIVLAHPEAKSFNAHLSAISGRELGAAGWQTTLADLYAMDFDPREGPHHYEARKDPEQFHTQTEQRFNADADSLPPEVNSEIEHLRGADLLVVHFPLWWFGMPAILKGWIDRVFVYGRMYRSTAETIGTLSSRPLVPYNRDRDFDETKRLVADAPVYSPFVRHTPDAVPK